MDLPIFTGTHADLLIVVFHKIITTGHQRLQPLFDCLLTIIVNVSPYLKTLSMVASTKLLHLLEAFSTPWFLYSNQTNHHLVFFLLEIFNNIIQYQFDGNSNLIYTIIRKRNIFHSLANLPTDYCTIQKSLNKQIRKRPKHLPTSSSVSESDISSPTSPTSLSAPGEPEPGESQAKFMDTENCEQPFNVSLAATPRIDKMTERTHPSPNATDSSPDGEISSNERHLSRQSSNSSNTSSKPWMPTSEWVNSWKQKLPLQTIMRMLQVRNILTLSHEIFIYSFYFLGVGSTGRKDVYRQRHHRRERNFKIFATWNFGWSFACSPSYPDSQIPNKRRNYFMVSYLHVGNRLLTKCRSSGLVRYER